MIKEFNKGTMVILPIPVKGNYLFTIEKALSYMVSIDRLCYLEDMMIYNVPVRDAIRNNGIRAVADELLEYVLGCEKLKKELDEFASKDVRIADFDIQILPITAELTFFGKRIGFKQLDVDCLELMRRIGRWTSERERKDDTLHVAQIYEPFPCFDSFDYANETRSYDNYIIRDWKITEEDCKKLEDANHGYNYCFVVESLPSEFLPMVYRNGDDRFMYVATSKDNPQVTPAELAMKR